MVIGRRLDWGGRALSRGLCEVERTLTSQDRAAGWMQSRARAVAGSSVEGIGAVPVPTTSEEEVPLVLCGVT